MLCMKQMQEQLLAGLINKARALASGIPSAMTRSWQAFCCMMVVVGALKVTDQFTPFTTTDT